MHNLTNRELTDLLADYDDWRADREALTARMDQGERIELFDSDDHGLWLLDRFADAARNANR